MIRIFRVSMCEDTENYPVKREEKQEYTIQKTPDTPTNRQHRDIKPCFLRLISVVPPYAGYTPGWYRQSVCSTLVMKAVRASDGEAMLNAQAVVTISSY